MPDRAIEAIIFDMVGVLIFRDAAYRPITDEQRAAEHIVGLYNHVDDRRLLRDVTATLGLASEAVDRAFSHIPDGYARFEDLWRLLPDLTRRYKLAVINDGNAVALPYWRRKFDFGGFDAFVNSAVEGTTKGDAAIYLTACRRLQVDPGACLFMDDTRENVETAASLGMATIWWEDGLQGLATFRTFLAQDAPELAAGDTIR